jgi:hypothetical protein
MVKKPVLADRANECMPNMSIVSKGQHPSLGNDIWHKIYIQVKVRQVNYHIMARL